jgi:hypothetical protein
MHHQDKLLIIEALIAYGEDARDLTPRERRAWDLADGLLASQDLSPDALVSEIDDCWAGPELE